MTDDRTKFIGGSDVAGILGISPWKTPLDVYLDKTQPRMPARTDDARERVLSRGKRMEPYVIDLLAEEAGLRVIRRGERYKDAEHPFLAAEIDAEAHRGPGEIVNVEIKTVHPFKAREWGEEQTDSVPVYYTAQAMHGLMVTGRNETVFGVLIGADDFRVYRVLRDEETIAAIRQRELDFWDRVQSFRPPEATTAADILRMFERDTGTSIEATETALAAFNRLRDLRGQIKALASQADEAEEQIKLFMQGNSTLTAGGKPLATWRTQSASRFDQKAFGAAHPKLLEQFKTITESRVFRLK